MTSRNSPGDTQEPSPRDSFFPDMLRRFDRAFWTLAILLLVLTFLWRERDEISRTIVVLRTARIGWVLALLATACAMHLVYTLMQSAILARLGHRIPLVPAILTYIERQTVATVVPVGGVPSAMLLMRRFAQFDVSNNDAIFSVGLYSVIGHLSFIVLLLPVLGWLLLHHAASGIILIWTGIFLVIAIAAAGIVVALARGVRLPDAIERKTPRIVAGFLDAIRQQHIPLATLAAPFALSLLGDVAGVAGVYLGLRAVGADASPINAAVGYTVGTLFLLVAPVFQGIGVVEISMTVALQQFGVPASQALGATMLYRIGEVWLPVVFGIAIQARHQKRLLGLPAHLPALFTAASGVIAISTVMPLNRHRSMPFPHRHVENFPFWTLPNASRTVTLAAGFLLIVLAYSLFRRQRTAWILAVILTATVAISQLSRDPDRAGAILTIANLVVLLVYAGRFRVKSDVPTIRRGLAIFATALGLAFAYGISSLWLVDRRHFGHEFSLRSAAKQSLDVFFSLDSAGLAPRTEYANWLVTSFHLVGGISILIAVLALVRPIVWRHRTATSERERARGIISMYGNSSLDRFKYWPDKRFFFSSSGNGVVSYGQSGSVALALGDPNARDVQEFQHLLQEFLDFCDSNGWLPAFHQVSPTYLDAYRAEGLILLRIGMDAVVSIPDFTLSGKSMKSLRAVPNRFAREGIRIERIEPPIPPDILAGLREVSDDWLTLDGRRERGFTLGLFDDAYIAESPILLARSSNGRIEAFINIIPDGVHGEITFDLMRHRQDAPNGAMDMLLISLIEYGRSCGYESVSLGMVPFIGADSGDDADLPERAIALLSRPLGRYFASQSLWNYKNKFKPTWEPRYLVIHSMAALPQVAIALNRLTETVPDPGRRQNGPPHA
ncbi:MAG TPA: phosphatidylglycerol lysyltransferase domain-containing protein [Thermomicrobiales bacterium]|nr:phosphatidylglycerol lysyltransferase domain-containing protein [Thermomicrobiales bacterium]